MALHQRDGGIPRSSVAVVAVVASALLAGAGSPYAIAPLALALTIAAAAALVGSADRAGASLTSALPPAFLLLVCWAVAWGLLRGALGVGGWADRGDAVLGVACFAAVALAVSLRRRGRVAPAAGDWPALVGGGLLALLGAWVAASQPLALWSRATSSGTDFLRHLYLVREIASAGGLQFGGSAYPSGLHATGALLVSTVASGTSAAPLWVAIAGISWLMLCLMLVAIMTIAGRAVRGSGAPAPTSAVASILAGGAFVQTAWFSTFLAFGSIMNMLVAVALLCLLSTGLAAGSYGSRVGTLVAASAMAVTANGWQLLLPVAAAGSLVWFAQWWRRGRGRPGDWAIWTIGAVLTLNGVLGVLDPGNRGVVGGATVSNLFAPDWWWWAALALAVGLAVDSYRRGLRSWALTAGALPATGIGLVAVLFVVTGSTWDLMLYYPVKAMWTVLVLVIPLASAGLVRLADVAFRRAERLSGVARTAARAGVAATLGLAVAGVLGRGAAFPPHLETLAAGDATMPNWSLAVVDALSGVEVPAEEKQGVVVFGIVPSGSVPMVTGGYVGAVDYMVMEALRFTPVGGDAYAAPVKGALSNRDMTAVCRYLKDHPKSLRITGPNPRAGAEWIRESGCPAEVVDSGRWISLDLDPWWLQDSLWQMPSLQFPTVDEVRRATAGV